MALSNNVSIHACVIENYLCKRNSERQHLSCKENQSNKKNYSDIEN